MKTLEDFIKQVEEKYNTSEFKILKYEKSTAPLIYQCLQCNNIYTLQRASRLISKDKKFLCNNCRPKSSFTGVKQITYYYRDKYEKWYNNTGKYNYDIIREFQFVNKPITLRCKKCNCEQNRKIKSLLEDDLCLICEKHIVAKKSTDYIKQEFRNSLYGEEYEILGEYKGMHEKMLIKHICGFIYNTTASNFLTKGRRCPKCMKKQSKGEKQIQNILLQNNITFELEKRFEDFMKKPYDFYLPDYNLVIEYNGIQHYKPVDLFGGVEQLNKQQQIDIDKQKYCINKGIRLLIISYEQFDKIEDILKETLKLNDHPERE